MTRMFSRSFSIGSNFRNHIVQSYCFIDEEPDAQKFERFDQNQSFGKVKGCPKQNKFLEVELFSFNHNII